MRSTLFSPVDPDPFPFNPQESQHSFSSLHSTGKVMLGRNKKTKQTAKETMQAKMIGKIPLRNDTKVLKIESRREKSPLPATNVKLNKSEQLRYR